MTALTHHNQGDDPTMKPGMPAMIGGRYSIVAYVDTAVFQKIESIRGDVPRSRFVGKLIQKGLA
jgi:hypothetical protein